MFGFGQVDICQFKFKKKSDQVVFRSYRQGYLGEWDLLLLMWHKTSQIIFWSGPFDSRELLSYDFRSRVMFGTFWFSEKSDLGPAGQFLEIESDFATSQKLRDQFSFFSPSKIEGLICCIYKFRNQFDFFEKVDQFSITKVQQQSSL